MSGMGGPGDHPLGDLIHWGRNAFPADMADMLLKLHALDPTIRNTFALEAYDWAEGRSLDEGRARLRAALARHQAENP